MLCFRKIPVAKKISDKGGGASRSSVETFSVSECRKVSKGKTSVLCFRNIAVARNSMDKRGGYQNFPSKFFCTTMPKILARERFCVVFQRNFR